MQAILGVTLPFFALVLIGYGAAARGWLSAAAIPGLNGFVLFFALPCMLFRFGRSTPVAQLLDPVLVGVYATSAVTIVAFTIALTRGRRSSRQLPLSDAAFGALVAAFPNTGFMGVPLLVALLGPGAAGPAITTILIDLILTTTLCIVIAEAGQAAHGGPRHAAIQALKGAARNPLPWAVAAGAVAGALALPIPAPVDQVIKLLADAASPVALFTIGAVLWRSHQPSPKHAPGSRRTSAQPASAGVWATVMIKLVLHPMLVFGIGVAAVSIGAALTTFQLMVITLVAALPSASNVSLLAERYGADNGRVARIILATTVLAFVSFSLIAFGFGVSAGKLPGIAWGFPAGSPLSSLTS
jgi:malonate transporter and related proteins